MGKRRPEEPEKEMDLLPILNLVLIMIPLLLLGLIFVEIAVLDVTMASKAPSAATPPTEAPPPKLQVLVTKDGEFVVSLNDNPLDPVKAKPNDSKVPVDRYNWCEFYNLLAKIKNGEAPNPGLDYSKVAQFDLILAEDVTFDVMVRTMDVARYGRITAADFKGGGEQKELKPFPTFTCDEKDTAFNESRTPRPDVEENGNTVRGFNVLFPGTVLGMPQRN